MPELSWLVLRFSRKGENKVRISLVRVSRKRGELCLTWESVVVAARLKAVSLNAEFSEKIR